MYATLECSNIECDVRFMWYPDATAVSEARKAKQLCGACNSADERGALDIRSLALSLRKKQ